MKQLFLATATVFALSGTYALAGEGHAHKGKDKNAAHAHKGETCEKCKKDEKDCKCDHKDEHGHEHDEKKEEKKETK